MFYGRSLGANSTFHLVPNFQQGYDPVLNAEDRILFEA